jgi:iron(III) transport system substrate-binding protein
MQLGFLRRAGALAAGAAILVGIAGCGGASAPASTAGGAATASSAPAATTSGSKGQLVIYAAEGYDQAMANAFQQKTGIQVKLSDMSTGPLVAKVEAEGSNPQWDVAWFDGDGTMATLDAQGLLLKGWEPANAANYDALGKSLIPADQSYAVTGTTAAGAIAYNTKYVTAAQAPKTWADLLQPQWKGLVGMDNPAISGPTFPVVAGFLYGMGMGNGQKFFAQLKANGLKVFATNKPTLSALSNGSIKIAIAQDSAEIDAIKKGSPLAIVYPTDGVTMLPSAIGISAHAPDMAAAKEFVNFALSAAGQQIMLTKGGGDSNFAPLINGEKPNPSRQQTGIKWNVVPAAWQAENYNSVQAWFKANIVG